VKNEASVSTELPNLCNSLRCAEMWSLAYCYLINRFRRNIFSHITYFRYYYKFLCYLIIAEI